MEIYGELNFIWIAWVWMTLQLFQSEYRHYFATPMLKMFNKKTKKHDKFEWSGSHFPDDLRGKPQKNQQQSKKIVRLFFDMCAEHIANGENVRGNTNTNITTTTIANTAHSRCKLIVWFLFCRLIQMSICHIVLLFFLSFFWRIQTIGISVWFDMLHCSSTHVWIPFLILTLHGAWFLCVL